VRVATWNVNGLRARLDFLLHWLRARGPDVVLLQELKLLDDDFPRAEFESLGYSFLCHGQKAWNGVAVLSRQPVEALQVGLPGQEAFGARLLSVRTGGIVATSVYVPNGKHVGHEDFPRKLAWLDVLADHLEAQRAGASGWLVGGDFNLCPAALDSWNEAALKGRIFHTDEERARFGRLLALGLVDAFRALHPETRAFSWWDYRAGSFHKGQGLRIDLLLAGAPLAPRLRAAEIDREWRKKQEGLTPSDHAPVWADLGDGASLPG
jgi:exodeoxyribonuclease III